MTETKQTESYILIVEDSAVDYEITTRALRKAGIGQDFFRCEDGDQALDFLLGVDAPILRKGSPDMILLDLNLPGTDGREVLRQIKTHDDTRKIPVVVLTTSIHDKDVEVCYQTGANSYVKKPTRPDDYVEIAESLKSFWFDRATLPEERQGIV